MSRGFYSPSSVYTRRQTSDVFHNDPFKIQSYNFHYAERPAYPVQHYQRPPPKLPEPPPFNTYYYNAKFHRERESPRASPATSSFVETRRRQFLQDFNLVSRPARKEIGTGLRSSVQVRHPVASIPPAVVTNPPLLRSCCNREDYKVMRRGQSVTTMRQSNCSTSPTRTGSRRASVSSFSFRQPEKTQSQATIKLSPRRSASSCSGCAININIRGMDSEVDLDRSLRIKIETDSCLHSNTDTYNVHTVHGGRKCGGSTESFVIDKRLSKFSMADVQATSWTRKRSSEQDALRAKRLQVQAEQERLETLRQQELKKDQERARQRDKERERLRQAERQRDHQRLLELEVERENQRLRELEREMHIKREQEQQREIERDRERERERQRQRLQRMPMRAMSMPSSITPPVVMTSHLHKPASTDRLPGMMPCYARQSAANSRSERLQSCTRKLLPLITTRRPQETPPGGLERRSSGTSNYNASVAGSGSHTSMRQLSTTRLNERKLLNLQVNGVPVSTNLPIHARINNMPIRITTSQPADEHLQFSVNRVRVANASPMAAQERSCNFSRSRSSSRSGLEESPSTPCSVSINVYADNPRTMRL
ncbi:uncharacterized protein LOC117784027 [Drosophila innubila]|uniref:uncharacterized protein LOC117784027 n=1 Tax=Drosophila innubila TaxID=198719 RepID=UPI00148CB0E3|nr:uncharacterized protein LOC117784027 [Drosophila innubila]